MNNTDIYLNNLIKGTYEDDVEKTAELVSYLYPIVSRYVSGMLAASGNAYVDDVTQDTILKAVKTIQKGTDIDSLIPWVKRIARNTALDFLKSASVQRSVAFSDLGDENNNLTYDPSDERISSRPDLALDEKTRQQIVMEVLDTLPEDQRTVIMLKFYDNLTISEIAAELDIPQSTVIGRLQKGKTKIKRSITEIQDRDGIKLYGLAPFPFFLYLFKNWQTANLVPAAGAAGVSAAAGAEAVASASESAACSTMTRNAENASSASRIAEEGVAAAGSTAAGAAKKAGLFSKISDSTLAFKAGLAAAAITGVIGGAAVVRVLDGNANNSLFSSDFVGKYEFVDSGELLTVKSDGTCVDDLHGFKTACTWKKIKNDEYELYLDSALGKLVYTVVKEDAETYNVSIMDVTLQMKKK